MPEFIIVQCFQCELFQVGQRRKDAKFTYKVCGAAQSVRRVFTRSGRAGDLRPAVQAAKLARGTAEGAFEQLFPGAPPDEGKRLMEHRTRDDVSRAESRWAAHAGAVENPNPPDEASDIDDAPDFVTALLNRATSACKRRRQAA